MTALAGGAFILGVLAILAYAVLDSRLVRFKQVYNTNLALLEKEEVRMTSNVSDHERRLDSLTKRANDQFSLIRGLQSDTRNLARDAKLEAHTVGALLDIYSKLTTDGTWHPVAQGSKRQVSRPSHKGERKRASGRR